MEAKAITVNVGNLGELKELLQKATNQLEQLEKTVELINNFQLEIELEKATAVTVTHPYLDSKDTILTVRDLKIISRLQAKIDALERENRKFKNQESSQELEYKEMMKTLKNALKSSFDRIEPMS